MSNRHDDVTFADLTLWYRWHNGVRVKGCRGTVTVRFRNDRYEVVR